MATNDEIKVALTVIEAKIDKIQELAVDTKVSIAEHTVLFKTQQDILTEHTNRSTKLENIVMPIKSYVERQQGFISGFLYIFSALGAVAAIAEVIYYLRH